MTLGKLRYMVLAFIAMATFITLSVVIMFNNGMNLTLVTLCISLASIYLLIANIILVYNVIYLIEENKHK